MDLCAVLQKHNTKFILQKMSSRTRRVASYGEFIEQTVTETCTFQHARKFPMTSVWDILLYLSISFSVYLAQSLFGACFSEDATTSSSLSRQGSFWPEQSQHTTCCWAVSRHNMWSIYKCVKYWSVEGKPKLWGSSKNPFHYKENKATIMIKNGFFLL